jgi:hypothetical protein
MYTNFSAVLRQQRKSDVMTYFGHSTRSAVYLRAGSPLGSCNSIDNVPICWGMCRNSLVPPAEIRMSMFLIEFAEKFSGWKQIF